jgi:hypothetical protein
MLWDLGHSFANNSIHMKYSELMLFVLMWLLLIVRERMLDNPQVLVALFAYSTGPTKVMLYSKRPFKSTTTAIGLSKCPLNYERQHHELNSLPSSIILKMVRDVTVNC